MFFIPILSLFLIICVHRLYHLRRYTQLLKRYSGPEAKFLVGNSLEFKDSTMILPNFQKYTKQYGGIVKLSIGPWPTVLLITDQKFLEFLLTTTKILDKPTVYTFFSRWLGSGLVTSTGDYWRKHRKIITPTFHFKILEGFVDTFNACAETLAAKLNEEVDKNTFDIYPYISLCTLEVICETAMGVTIDVQSDENSEYVRSVKKMCSIMVTRTFKPIFRNDFIYRFSKTYREEKKALAILHEATRSVIIQKKKDLLANSEKGKKSKFAPVEGAKRKLAFLDLLLEANANENLLSDEELREEVDTFMFAGHDTTASTISFTLYCIAKYPDVQQKLIEELLSISENDLEKTATYRDLQEMKYLECVIKETLRLYPTIPFYARRIPQDIEYDGTILPKGLSLTVFAYGIHRNPDIYPDPETFDPDRFSIESQIGRSPYSYVPFSAGPRNCIGQKYAMFEMKSIISTLMRKYEFFPATPAHSPKLAAETVLKSLNGICVRIRHRELF